MLSDKIRRLAERYLRNVRPSGEGNLRAECPFHKSKSASRSLYVTKEGSWTCFSCHAGGSVYHLLYKLGLSGERVQQEIGELRLPPPLPELAQRKLEGKQGWEWHVLPEYVLGAYNQCPLKMLDLGFSEDILQEMFIGYDASRDRITFPIRDYLGRLVGISGRAYDDWVEPRYYVYEKEFHDIVPGYTGANRKHLYAFDRIYAARFFADEGARPPLVIVEGYKGCLWCIEHGFPHTVALQGSTLTKQQERLITRLRGPYYVLLDHEPGKGVYFPDPDKNRRCSAIRIAQRLSRSGRAYVCLYPDGSPEGTSPDDLDTTHLSAAVTNAKTIGQLATLPGVAWTRRSRRRSTP